MGQAELEPANAPNYRELIREAVLDEGSFLQLVFSQPRGASPWVKVRLRPVLIKGRRHIQFSYFDGKKEIAKNYAGEALDRELAAMLALPFRYIHVQATTGDIHVRIARDGRASVQRGKPSRPEAEPALAHDRQKARPLAVGQPDPFLRAVGIADERGQVRPAMRGKYRQVNQFLRVIEQMVANNLADRRAIHIVDCGCGAAYLTFAAYHYLEHVKGLEAHVVGVDVNREIIEAVRKMRDELGWERLTFEATAIADFAPPFPPDIVLSLHACDTATDEAIALGIRQRSPVILAAPCCQHELHHQLAQPLFQPVLRHGILRERLADILTDAFRASILRIMGYRAQVVEFVSPEHTAKNLLIQAERGLPVGEPRLVAEYESLKAYWGVTPALERLLGDEWRRAVQRKEGEATCSADANRGAS